ncbi:MAG TPA: DPP IV N-terminal domain-containing protein [Caldilineaceae bacterium]|nr:DPP IV N-terminal domain-containing protein [Caldilineaceae bacterium]
MNQKPLQATALVAVPLFLLVTLFSRLDSPSALADIPADVATQTALAGDAQLNHLFLPLLTTGALEPQSGSRLILAEHGGTLQLDNITLFIPPHALPQNTFVSLNKPQVEATLDEDGIELVGVEPTGLSLLKPATLTVRYNDSASLDEHFLNVAGLDAQTGEWVHYPISQRDSAQNTFSVAVTRFSLHVVYSDEPLYLALDLPAKYLQPGDLLFSLAPACDTGVAYWMAGYTAIYSETVPFGSGKPDIIEAAPFGGTRLSCPAPGGVREWTLANFTGRSCNFYLGARRPPLASAGQGQAARDFATRQIGKGYLRIDQSVTGDRAGNCYSCAGLVENAYQTAGANLIPTGEQPGLLTPLQLFERTAPVSEITVGVGEPVRIPVRGVVKVQQPSAADRYQLGGTLWGSNLPDGSRFRDGVFEWTPQLDDDGQTFAFAFSLAATVGDRQYTVTQPFTITVRSALPATPTSTPSPTLTPSPSPTPTPATPTPAPTNRPPNVPAAPSPPDGALEQRTDVILNWLGGDPDGDAVTYAVYLSARSNPPTTLIAGKLDSPQLNPGALAGGVTYYWRVVARDAQGATAEGPVWRFTTKASLPVNNYAPVWSPDGQRLLFVSYQEGNGDLYVVDLAGRHVTRLTDHPADDYAPAWSPDGNTIAFWSERDGNGEVYLVKPDGSGLANLTNNPANDAFDGIAAWSPDGRSLVFMSNRDGNSEIYRMDADGTTVLNLTRHPAEDYAPAWSPDGSRILFLSDRDGNVEIYSMDAAGGNLVNLTKNAADDYDPVWSPDGSQIAFGSNRDGNSEIYVMNAAGGNPINLTNGTSNEFYPIWSPDGRAIAFWTNRDGNGEVYLMSASGANPINLTKHTASDHRPRWSPDGAKLAFERWQNGVSDVWVMNADGSQQMSLPQLLAAQEPSVTP